jgi:uncharacterized protein
MTRNLSVGARSVLLLVLVVLAAGLWGCASSAPSRYYGLSPMSASESTPSKASRPFTVGVTRLTLPEFLDKPQIATRLGPHEIRYDEFNRWAEPLKENIPRILGENLSALLGPERVIVSGGAGALTADYHVWVEVIQFDAGTGGDFLLAAQWSIYNHEKKKVIVRKRFNTREQVDGSDYVAMTAAASKALAALSRDIATGINKLP